MITGCLHNCPECFTIWQHFVASEADRCPDSAMERICDRHRAAAGPQARTPEAPNE